MEITNNQYQRWKKLALVITKDEYIANEVISDVTYSLIKKSNKYPDWSKTGLTDSFVFISIKNAHLNWIKREDIRKGYETKYSSEKIEIDNVEEEINEIDRAALTREKLLHIEKIMLQQDEYYQQIYILYFIKKMSTRKIEEMTGISHMTIWNNVNQIKKIIKDNYENK